MNYLPTKNTKLFQLKVKWKFSELVELEARICKTNPYPSYKKFLTRFSVRYPREIEEMLYVLNEYRNKSIDELNEAEAKWMTKQCARLDDELSQSLWSSHKEEYENKIKRPINKKAEEKTRCVQCNVIINKRNVKKHCDKVHKNVPLSKVFFDDAGLSPSPTKYIDYYEYIQSPEWKRKSQRIKQLAGYRCQICNTNNDVLDVHHRTYERLGKELDSDLTVLCRSCHKIFEENSQNRPARKK